jgi:hypothetical protein
MESNARFDCMSMAYAASFFLIMSMTFASQSVKALDVSDAKRYRGRMGD